MKKANKIIKTIQQFPYSHALCLLDAIKTINVEKKALSQKIKF